MGNSIERGKKGILLLFGKPIPANANATILYHDKASLETDDGKNPVLLLSDFFEFPCADASMSEIEATNGLEYLEKKYLYMILSEARRTIGLGGQLTLQSQEILSPWKFLEPIFTNFFGKRFLQLHHFFSPEDWAVAQEKEEKSIFFLTRTLVLTRIDHIPSETDGLDETNAPDQDRV